MGKYYLNRCKNGFDDLCEKTKYIFNKWKNYSSGYVPDQVTKKLDKAMLSWIIELTESLNIWIEKGESMTNGELILARTNLGAIVEGWLKFFFSVYYLDYRNTPITRGKNTKIIEPEDAEFEGLKKLGTGILWDLNDDYYKWVDSVKKKRNAIHSFKFRDIGTIDEFFKDVIILKTFISEIETRLPDIDETI